MGMTKCSYCWGNISVVCAEWIGWKKGGLLDVPRTPAVK